MFICSIVPNPASEVINLDEDVPPANNIGGTNNRSNRVDRIAFVYPGKWWKFSNSSARE